MYDQVVDTYLSCAWTLLKDESSTYASYHDFFNSLINTCELLKQNLAILLYYLYKYKSNEVNNNDCSEGSNFSVYLVLTSLILCNKTYDDQSYTLKTWVSICESISGLDVSLKLLLSLETHFMAALNYRVSFTKITTDAPFWKLLRQHLNMWYCTIAGESCCSTPKAKTAQTTYLRTPVFLVLLIQSLVLVLSYSTPLHLSLLHADTLSPLKSHQFVPITPETPFFEPEPRRRKLAQARPSVAPIFNGQTRIESSYGFFNPQQQFTFAFPNNLLC